MSVSVEVRLRLRGKGRVKGDGYGTQTYESSRLIWRAGERPSSNEVWCILSRQVRMLEPLENSRKAMPRQTLGLPSLWRQRMALGL